MLTKWLSLLKGKSTKFKEDHNIVDIQFEYFNEFEELMQYQKVLELRTQLGLSCKIYRIKNVANSIDFFDCLYDEKEFNETLKESGYKNDKYRFTIDKESLCNLFFERYKNIISKNDFNIFIFSTIQEINKEFDIEINQINELEQSLFNKAKNIIIALDGNMKLYNEKIMFISLNNIQDSDINDFAKEKSYVDENHIIKSRNLNCNWIDGTKILVPENIKFDFSNNKFIIDNEFKNIAKKIMIKLIIAFISNYSGFVDNKLISIINASKKIEIDFENMEECSDECYENLYKVYIWTYDNMTIDKITICRNVIGSLITAKCQGSKINTIMNNSDLLHESIKENFKVFITHNIEKFFDERSKLKKSILEHIDSLTEEVSKLINIIVTNMVTLVGVIIAGAVAYLGKSQIIVIQMLSFLYLVLFDINIVINVPYIFFKYYNTSKDFKKKCTEYKKTYFEDIENTEINDVSNKMKRSKVLFWVYIIGFAVISFVMNAGLINFMKTPFDFAKCIVDFFA